MLAPHVRRVVETAADWTRNEDGFWTALAALDEHAADAPSGQLSIVVQGLAELFPIVPPDGGAALATRCAALIERGADPTPIVAPLTACAMRALRGCAQIARAWPELPEADMSAPVIHDELVHSRELSHAEAYEAAAGWTTIDTWRRALSTVLQYRVVREQLRAIPLVHRSLDEAVSACYDYLPDLIDVACLLAVLDDEPLLVVHRASQSGYRLIMAGIADVFQLHTLLAHLLIGPAERGLIDDAGPGPDPAQVAAATDGRRDAPMRSYFTLRDVHGEEIWNQSIPVDIPRRRRHRLIVLDTQERPTYWPHGRSFSHMRPTLELSQQLNQAQLERFGRIAPPITDDSLAGQDSSRLGTFRAGTK